jgi:hypothetical protein
MVANMSQNGIRDEFGKRNLALPRGKLPKLKELFQQVLDIEQAWRAIKTNNQEHYIILKNAKSDSLSKEEIENYLCHKEYLQVVVQKKKKKKNKKKKNKNEIRLELIRRCYLRSAWIEQLLIREQQKIDTKLLSLFHCKQQKKNKKPKRKRIQNPLSKADIEQIEKWELDEFLIVKNDVLLQQLVQHYNIVLPTTCTTTQNIAMQVYLFMLNKMNNELPPCKSSKPKQKSRISKITLAQTNRIINAARALGFFEVVQWYEEQVSRNENYFDTHRFPRNLVQGILVRDKPTSRTMSVFEKFATEAPDEFRACNLNLLPFSSNSVWTNANEAKSAYAKRRFCIDNSTMKLVLCEVCGQFDIANGVVNDHPLHSPLFNHYVVRTKHMYYDKEERMYYNLFAKEAAKRDQKHLTKLNTVCNTCIRQTTMGDQPMFDLRNCFNQGITPLSWMKELTWAEKACCKMTVMLKGVILFSLLISFDLFCMFFCDRCSNSMRCNVAVFKFRCAYDTG